MKVLNAADGCKEKKQAHYQVAEAWLFKGSGSAHTNHLLNLD